LGGVRRALLVSGDCCGVVRGASEAMDVPVLNKPVKPAALRSMMTRVRRLAPAAE
jgi:hypothetical protein